MAQHITIRREEYVAGTRDRPEVGVFVQTHSARPPIPWDQIVVGESVWMKWKGGPIVARSTVQGFRQIADCTPEQLRETTRGFRLYDLEDYWTELHPVFFGMTIYLEKEAWLDQPIEPATRSRGGSWILLSTPEDEALWLSPGRLETGSQGTSSTRGTSRTIPATLRFQVLRRDGFACTYCGRQPPGVTLHVDHIVAFSRGGTTTLENLRTACSDCNIGKGATSL